MSRAHLSRGARACAVRAAVVVSPSVRASKEPRRFATEATTAELPKRRRTGPTGWSLLVLGEFGLRARRLPTRGEVVIGRSEKAHIRIDDPSVSRRHAILHLGARVEIEDLGSA